MAFENLFITTKAKIGGISIDGSIRESTNRQMRMTINPIEDGSNITDHVIREPIRVTIQGVITDTPMGISAFNDPTASTIGGVVDSATGIFGTSTPNGETRSQQAYRQLVALLEQKQLMEISTRLETYENMIFSGIYVDQDKTTSRAVFFTATFTEALIVVSASSSVDPDNITQGEDAAGLGDIENGGTASKTIASESSETSAAISLGL